MKKISLGKLILGSRPAIVVPFSGTVTAPAVRRAKAAGMDAAELRLDLYPSLSPDIFIREIRKFKGTPVIATVRSRKEGGKWSGSEKERLELFKAVFPLVDAVDIELSSKVILKEVLREARRLKKTVIVSYHNFSRTPSRPFLEKILKDAKSAGAGIVKIAAMARSEKDLRILAEFTGARASENLITLSMGSRGAFSGVLLPALGSLLTFAHTGKATAPGQLDLKTTALYLEAFNSRR